MNERSSSWIAFPREACLDVVAQRSREHSKDGQCGKSVRYPSSSIGIQKMSRCKSLNDAASYPGALDVYVTPDHALHWSQSALAFCLPALLWLCIRQTVIAIVSLTDMFFDLKSNSNTLGVNKVVSFMRHNVQCEGAIIWSSVRRDTSYAIRRRVLGSKSTHE